MNAWKKLTLTCLSLLVLGLAPIETALAQVRVTAATPSSAYQGTIALDVVVNGSGFDPSAKVQYFVTGTTNPGGIVVRKVTFRNSKELVTTIDVADAALLEYFDIQVVLDSGRKGKGTTLFSVKAKPSPAQAAPTYPPARFYHAFTSNGEVTAAAGRLYMFGGTRNWSGEDLGDLWSYTNAGSTGAAWTLMPEGTSSPGPRRQMGWSCGGGWCVAVNGLRGPSMVKETWVFNEVNQTWSAVNCKRPRVVCPSERTLPATAYDAAHGVHVLFGGDGYYSLLDDMFLFDSAKMSWKQVSVGAMPPARGGAAAAYVPEIGVVMSGGFGNQCCVTVLNDMHAWDGTTWSLVTPATTSDPAPALWGHSIAWDPVRVALIVAGGFTTSGHAPNLDTWYVTFTRSQGAWQAVWTLASVGCQSSAGSPPDAQVHEGARMAFDSAGRVQVYFGGEAFGGAAAYGNTVECR